MFSLPGIEPLASVWRMGWRGLLQGPVGWLGLLSGDGENHIQEIQTLVVELRSCKQSGLPKPKPNWNNNNNKIPHRLNERILTKDTTSPDILEESLTVRSGLILLTLKKLLGCLVEKAMAPHSSTLAWKIPWMEEPGRLQSMGSQRVGHDWVTSLSLFTFMRWRRKWKPTPVFLPGESQGQGSWWAAVYGVAQRRTRLKRLSSSSSSSLSYLEELTRNHCFRDAGETWWY